jgi:hypothetical protein
MTLGHINKTIAANVPDRKFENYVNDNKNSEAYSAYLPKKRIRCLNIGMSIFHTAFFSITLIIGNLNLRIPIYMTNITFVRNDSSTNPAFQLIPTYVEYGHVYLTIMTSIFFLCSAIAHFGNAILWKKFYEQNLSECKVTSRWIEYFFSASIMIYIIAFNSGIREHLLLWGITLLIAATMPFGFLTEIFSRPVNDSVWNHPLSQRLIFHCLGYIPQLGAWTLILLNFYSEKISDPPTFVYAIIWLQLFLFFSFGLVQLFQICSIPANYYKGEIAYQCLSLFSKGLLGVLLLSNVLVLDSYNEVFT